MGQLATSNQGCAYTSVPIQLKIQYPKNDEIKDIRSGSFCCCAMIGPKQEEMKKVRPKRKTKLPDETREKNDDDEPTITEEK